MEYITTFSLRSPQVKTELAPVGGRVNVTQVPENVLNRFFRDAPVLSHQTGSLVSASATGPIEDNFNKLLDKARRT